jgi:nucleobase:cation symporter-1, NCS1 family
MSCLQSGSVISGWGIFLAPMAGIVLADYFVVHRRELHLDDLYIGNRTSAYWYIAGFNWRAPVAWYVKFFSSLPLSITLCPSAATAKP